MPARLRSTFPFVTVACAGLTSLLFAGPAEGAGFTYAPVGDPIVGATFSGDFAALVAHRYVLGNELNFARLTDPSGGAVPADLSDQLFGLDAWPNPPLLAQGPLQTGWVSAAIDPSFFPVLQTGNVGLDCLFTDTGDAMFAIDTLVLTIQTGTGSVQSFYGWPPGGENNGFGLGIPDSGNLPSPLPASLPPGTTGTGFDETISSKRIPEPSSLALLAATALLGLRPRRGRRLRMGLPKLTPRVCGRVALFAAMVATGLASTAAQATTQEDVAVYIRDHVYGPLDGTRLWMTDTALDTTYVARDEDPNTPDEPFPFASGWLVMIDSLPWADWGHPVLWVFVSDDLAVNTTPIERDFPPTVWGDYGLGEEENFGCVDFDPGLFGTVPCPDLGLPDPPADGDWADADKDCLWAVLVSGGYNAKNNHKRYKNNLRDMYNILRDCGFPKSHIWVYYDNGAALDFDGDGNSDVDGAASNGNISGTLTLLCTILAPERDVLFLYVTNHGVKGRGNALWDFNGDGKIQDNEVQKPSQLADDTKNCKVCRLFILMDTCYSGQFIGPLTDANHKNVAIYTSTTADKPSYSDANNSEYMTKWKTKNPSTDTMDAMHPATLPSTTPQKGEGTPGIGKNPLCKCCRKCVVVDQLHLYGPYPLPVYLGHAETLTASAQSGFEPCSPELVTFNTLAGNVSYTLGGQPLDGTTFTMLTDSDGLASVTFVANEPGPTLIQVSLDDWDLVTYAFFEVAPYALGDLNCDGQIDFGDINPFVLALSASAGYRDAFPGCDPILADCNNDGTVDFADIGPFVALLSGM